MIFDTFAFYVPIAVCFGKRSDKRNVLSKKQRQAARLK